jgi:predicted metalloprotease with PDZ domain
MRSILAMGLPVLLSVSGCAMHAAQTEASDYCEKRGQLPFVLAAHASLNPIHQSASVTARCVDPSDLVRSTAAFGVAMADFADLEGVAIVTVAPGSIADKADIKPGDLVLEYGGREMTRASELTAAIGASQAAALVPVKLLRNKKELSVTARF